MRAARVQAASPVASRMTTRATSARKGLRSTSVGGGGAMQAMAGAARASTAINEEAATSQLPDIPCADPDDVASERAATETMRRAALQHLKKIEEGRKKYEVTGDDATLFRKAGGVLQDADHVQACPLAPWATYIVEGVAAALLKAGDAEQQTAALRQLRSALAWLVATRQHGGNLARAVLVSFGLAFFSAAGPTAPLRLLYGLMKSRPDAAREVKVQLGFATPEKAAALYETMLAQLSGAIYTTLKGVRLAGRQYTVLGQLDTCKAEAGTLGDLWENKANYEVLMELMEKTLDQLLKRLNACEVIKAGATGQPFLVMVSLEYRAAILASNEACTWVRQLAVIIEGSQFDKVDRRRMVKAAASAARVGELLCPPAAVQTLAAVQGGSVQGLLARCMAESVGLVGLAVEKLDDLAVAVREARQEAAEASKQRDEAAAAAAAADVHAREAWQHREQLTSTLLQAVQELPKQVAEMLAAALREEGWTLPPARFRGGGSRDPTQQQSFQHDWAAPGGRVAAADGAELAQEGGGKYDEGMDMED